MISKFKLENQAFSSRVHNLKSKIEKAYTKFSGNREEESQSVDKKDR
jgi:hypothetical protein